MIGSCIVPVYISYLKYYDNYNPLGFFGIIGLIGVLCIYYLPETHLKGMRDHIEED